MTSDDYERYRQDFERRWGVNGLGKTELEEGRKEYDRLLAECRARDPLDQLGRIAGKLGSQR